MQQDQTQCGPDQDSGQARLARGGGVDFRQERRERCGGAPPPAERTSLGHSPPRRPDAVRCSSLACPGQVRQGPGGVVQCGEFGFEGVRGGPRGRGSGRGPGSSGSPKVSAGGTVGRGGPSRRPGGRRPNRPPRPVPPRARRARSARTGGRPAAPRRTRGRGWCGGRRRRLPGTPGARPGRTWSGRPVRRRAGARPARRAAPRCVPGPRRRPGAGLPGFPRSRPRRPRFSAALSGPPSHRVPQFH